MFSFHLSCHCTEKPKLACEWRPTAPERVISTRGRSAAAPTRSPGSRSETRQQRTSTDTAPGQLGDVIEPIILLSCTCRNQVFKFNYTTACYKNPFHLCSKLGQRLNQRLGRPKPSTATAPFPDPPLLFLLAHSFCRPGEPASLPGSRRPVRTGARQRGCTSHGRATRSPPNPHGGVFALKIALRRKNVSCPQRESAANAA